VLNILTVRFTIVRTTAGGGFVASCLEVGARLEASALPELEAKMSALVRALVDEPGDERSAILVRRRFPPRPIVG
jgi:hypothetical protein